MNAPKIYYSDGLVQSFERALRDAFNPRYVRLSRRPSKAVGRFNSVLDSGDREFKPSDADEPFNVIEIRHEGIAEQAFWVAFKANFDLWEHGEHFLEHISVSVLQQAMTGDLVRMFRAEWDSRAASDDRSNHAQPHWHFAMEEDDFRVAFPANDENGEATEPLDFMTPEQPSLQLIDFSGFHFAMSPLWYPNIPSCHRHAFQSSAELTSWFENLSTYISAQLAYICEKAGGKVKVKDFA